MPQPPTTLSDELGIALSNLADAAVAPFTQMQGLLTNNGKVNKILLNAIDPAQERQVSIIDDFVREGKVGVMDEQGKEVQPAVFDDVFVGGDNDFTGEVRVDNGSLRITDARQLGSGTKNIIAASTSAWNVKITTGCRRNTANSHVRHGVSTLQYSIWKSINCLSII